MTVAELEARMTCREMNEWLALLKIEAEEAQARELEGKVAAGMSEMRRAGFGGWRPQ